ncbi:unnamed protein product, partial [Timema podura]|nr:unnamed protein product [Timema podura]
GFGTVSLVEDAHTHKYYAVKKIICHGKEDQNIALKEVEFYNLLKHPNIIECIDSTLTGQPDPQFNFTSEVLMILPYYQKGTLFNELDYRSQTKNHIEPQDILNMFLQICEGVKAFHEATPEPLAHRDLKTSNIVIADDRTPIIMDLGKTQSKQLATKATHNSVPAIGTIKKTQCCSQQDLLLPDEHQASDLRVLFPTAGVRDSAVFQSSVAPARVKICGSAEAQTLQDIASERCAMPYRAPELFNVESYCMIDERTDIWKEGGLNEEASSYKDVEISPNTLEDNEPFLGFEVNDDPPMLDIGD